MCCELCACSSSVVWLHIWSVPVADHTLTILFSSLPRSPFNSVHKIWDAVQPLPIHVVFLCLFFSVPLFKVKIPGQVLAVNMLKHLKRVGSLAGCHFSGIMELNLRTCTIFCGLHGIGACLSPSECRAGVTMAENWRM